MSYARMDHVGWVRNQIDAHKRIYSKRKPRTNRYGQKVGLVAAPDVLTPGQERAITILGIVGGGIYNAPISWETVEWHDKGLAVTWGCSMSTWDNNCLSNFVFLCHIGCMRGDISPKGFNHLDVMLHQRSVRTGFISQRHPDLQTAVTDFMAYLGDNNPVAFTPPVPEEIAA